MIDSLTDEIQAHGFAVVEDVLPQATVSDLLASLEHIAESESVRRHGGIFAVRNLLEVSPKVRQLVASETIRSLVEPVLGPAFFPVRGILFDKIPNANWKVPWHQDVTIAVQNRVDTDDFGPWSMKANVLHVQPPPAILEQMISVRLHLDDCGEENGALRVIPRSHSRGRIAEQDIASVREQTPEQVCAVRAGGALLMRPLLLHASSPSRVPGHRRVLHLDFAAAHLPNGMQWLTSAG